MGKGNEEKMVAWKAILRVTGDGVSGEDADLVAMLPGRQYKKGQNEERAKGARIYYFCRANISSMLIFFNNNNRQIFTLLLIFAWAFVLSSCSDKKTASAPSSIATDSLEQCAPTTNAHYLPEGFCYVTDSIPDAVLDIRYYSENNFVGTRIDGYEAPTAILSTAATSALKQVANELRSKGYKLKIYDAYRPQKAVNHFVRWAQDPTDTAMKSLYYPDIPKNKIFSRGFVATKSSHSRGSTIDLTIVNTNSDTEVDMGGTFDFFGTISHTDYEGISIEQHQNRIMLRDIMMRYGFQPVRGEWWHFTLLNEPFPNEYFTFPVR